MTRNRSSISADTSKLASAEPKETKPRSKSKTKKEPKQEVGAKESVPNVKEEVKEPERLLSPKRTVSEHSNMEVDQIVEPVYQSPQLLSEKSALPAMSMLAFSQQIEQ